MSDIYHSNLWPLSSIALFGVLPSYLPLTGPQRGAVALAKLEITLRHLDTGLEIY